MAFVNLIFTASSLQKLKKSLIEEKLESIKADEDKSHKKKFKFSHIGVDLREAVKNFFKRLFKCSETSVGYKTCYKLGHEGSCENFVLKSVLGFIGGVFLTYFLYIFFIFQLNVRLTSATVVCSILGCFLTVGLAFSSKVRCVVLLTLPQFFSKRGRQALMAYAFVLALTGPAQNTLNNIGILSESLACGQEQLKQAVKQIIDVIKKPFMAIKEAIKKVIKTVKEVVKKIKEILLKIKRVIMALVRVIKSVFEFLGKIINICNKELGTPFERCTRVFENAIADCNAKLGSLFNWLCSLTYIVKAVCYIVKIFDYVCMLVDFISNSVVGVIIRKIKIFVRHIKTMFYVRIKFSHSFKYETVSSKTFTEIAKEIVAEIKDRSRGIVAFFRFMTSASMLFFLYLVFQVAYYRIRYLTSERFDNIYITKYFREIDERRAKVGRETVLPLTKKERQTYVPIDSGQLAKTEKRNLSKAATTLATASVKLATHMLADYCLYWILNLISYHARYQSKIQAPNFPVAHITGEGFIAKLLRTIVNAFQPVGIQLEIDTVPCLPIPIPPDFDRYIQIGITIVLCWILTVLEPYGLRFRNYIMGYYHPVRAKQRTIWLYNHILRYRTSFLLLARRKLRKKFGMGPSGTEMSCKDLLRSKLRCSIFRICLGSDLQLACLLCGEVLREKDKTKYVKCHTPKCPGLFCIECFADLKNICPVCLSPVEYGDLDDLDEEKDSSGDEPPPDKPKKKRKCPWLPCGKPDDDDKEPLIPKGGDHEEEHDETEEEPEDKDYRQQLKEDFEKVAEQSDSSTDYSYSYQYDEDYKDREPQPAPVLWRDVEMQAIPDEASMEEFRDEEEYLSIDLDNQIRVPKGHTALVKMDVVAEAEEDLEYDRICSDIEADTTGEEYLFVDLDNQIKVPKGHAAMVRMDVSAEMDEALGYYGEGSEENQPLLDTCDCSVSSCPRRVEFIGVPDTVTDVHKSVRRKLKHIPSDSQCVCSDLELLEENLPMSTMSTSTRSDCKYCRCPDLDVASTLQAGSETEEELKNIVPKLDLSFLEQKDKMCTCDKPILSSRFSYVKYQELSETPPASASNRSLESSSVLTSLKHPQVENKQEPPMIRKRNITQQNDRNAPNESDGSGQKNVKTQYSPPDVDSPSSMDSYEFNKAQNRKVRQYYEATRQACTNQQCPHGGKKRSITDMFKRLLPKRRKDQNYLPLHRRDVDDEVQVQSYNYNQENWDTLSLDTNSPTYPFGTQATSDTSEEEQALLGGRRIRGGECTHLINCRLIGRECPEKKGRSFDAKSRTRLKDFSTLSLPPKPKPADSKELFSRYFFNIEDLNTAKDTENSMKPTETTKGANFKVGKDLADREDSSDFVIPKEAVSTLSLEADATPPSSDSGLSETTCAAIFGSPCPQDCKKASKKRPNSTGPTGREGEETGEEVELSSGSEENLGREEDLASHKSGSTGSTKSKASKEDNLTAKKSSSSASRKSKSSRQSVTEEGQLIKKSESTESGGSKSSRQSSKRDDTGTLQVTQGEEQVTSQSGAKRKSTQLNQLLYKDERTEISLVQRLSPGKGPLKPRPAITIPASISPRLTPSVKLQISLHNSIIPEEGSKESLTAPADAKEDLEPIEMRSPRSQDKIVETQDSFPLHHDWIPADSNKAGKLVLARDNTQQTSDNDIYRTSNNSRQFSNERRASAPLEYSSHIISPSSLHTHPQVSSTIEHTNSSADPRSSTSRPYYSSELPEKDASCKKNCICSVCRIRQMLPAPDPIPVVNERESTQVEYSVEHREYKCSCCRCTNVIGNQKMMARPTYSGPIAPIPNTVPPPPANVNYQVAAFPISSTEAEFPEFLPPPPPRPPYPSRMAARRPASHSRPPSFPRPPLTGYTMGCGEHCNCHLKQRYPSNQAGYSGDYSEPSTSYRYPQITGYSYQGDYDPGYNAAYEDDDYQDQPGLSDLPYQNNEEYLELVQELQDTLHSRNRNRVKRAMQEFEDRSKHNKPLEKPIINYDETSESEEPIIRKIDQLRTDRKICCAEEKCSCGKKKERLGYGKPPKPRRRERLSAEGRPSHWTMDPSSGEWHKACKHGKYRSPKGSNESGEFDQCICNCDRRY